VKEKKLTQADCGLDGGFGLSVFLRDGEQVYRTCFTHSIGRLAR
jgi:hypothetical protein